MLRPSPLSSTQPLTCILLLAAAGALAGCHDTAAPTQLPRIRPIGRPGLSSVEAGIAGIAEGQVIVRFRAGADHSAVEQDHDAQHAAALLLDRTELLTVEVGKEESAAAELAQDPRVEFAQPNFATILAPCDVGNCLPTSDFLMGYRWDLHNTGFIVSGTGATLATTGRPDADIDWLEMFDALGAAPQGTATIGIIDTGIRGTHEELTGRVTQARNFAFGYATDPNFGPDFIIDRIGHGTHVAGIAAAHGNNGVGGSGIAYGPNIRLLNAKACEMYLSGTTVVNACFSSSVANAIVWSVDNGANVLNLSLGTPGNSTAGDITVSAAISPSVRCFGRTIAVAPSFRRVMSARRFPSEPDGSGSSARTRL